MFPILLSELPLSTKAFQHDLNKTVLYNHAFSRIRLLTLKMTSPINHESGSDLLVKNSKKRLRGSRWEDQEDFVEEKVPKKGMIHTMHMLLISIETNLTLQQL
jgi:hypothetical protein